MSGRKRGLRERFESRSMFEKMFLLYAVPVALVAVLVFLIGGRILEHRYEQELRRYVEQSMTQASGRIANTLQSVHFALTELTGSAELKEILGREEFGEASDLMGSYREYAELEQIFHQLSLDNPDIHQGLFVDNETRYANNEYYFYPNARLTQREDYDALWSAVSRGGIYYGIYFEERAVGNNIATPFLTAFSGVRGTPDGRVYAAKAGIRSETIERILTNAKASEGAAFFLTDERDRCLCSTVELRDPALPEGILEKKDWEKTVWMGRNCYVIDQRIEYDNWHLYQVIPVHEFANQFSFIMVWILLLGLLLVSVAGVVSLLIAQYYSGKIRTLNNQMDEVRDGQINALIPLQETKTSDEMDELYRNFDSMMAAVQKLMKEQYRLGQQITRAEMRALQAQINPHFLYNTLDLINWGAQDYGAESVAELARSLGQFYRLSLNKGMASILVADELKHVEAFVRIENAHYQDAVFLTIDVPEEVRSYACLNITLQPFVENAVVHGIGEHPEIEACHIRIGGKLEDGDILFTVEDDGPGIDAETAKRVEENTRHDRTRGYGISNINFRLKLCYGEEYGVHYDLEREVGTCACIRFKALSLEELDKLLI